MLESISTSRFARGMNIIAVLSFTVSPAIADSTTQKYSFRESSSLDLTQVREDKYALAARLTAKSPSAHLGGIVVELPETRVASLGPTETSVFLRCGRGKAAGPNEEIVNLTQGCSSVFVYATRPITVKIPYRADGIEQEIDESAIKLFRTATETVSLGAIEHLESFVDLPNKRTVATLTQQSGNYVVGILKNLEGPDRASSSMSPQLLTGLLQANPLTGIPLIAKPEPNSNGEARLSYPLDLPGTRQDFKPSLSINYVSRSGYGALGEGWHLNVPEISVETRWGVPIYDPDYETETYLFNGEQLVPETGRAFVGDPAAELQLLPMPHRTSYLRPRKKGEARFVLRRDDGLWRVIRHGNAPSDYWWEAWQENPGSGAPKISYFGHAPGRVPSAIEPVNSAGIFHVQRLGSITANPQARSISRWLLAREVDAHRNAIDYDWQLDCTTSPATADCSPKTAAELVSHSPLLSRILYTSNLATEETVLRCREALGSPETGCARDWALYEALFSWSGVDDRYRRSDGRSGGLTVVGRLLDRIDVRTRQVITKLGDQPLEWRCSAPFVGYRFDYKREFKLGGSDDIGSGAGRAFLSGITKQVSGAIPLFEPKPLTNPGTNPACGSSSGQWEENFTTRFDYDLDSDRSWKEHVETKANFGKAPVFGLIDHVRDALIFATGQDTSKGPLVPSMLGSTATTDATISFFAGLNFFNPGKVNALGVKAHNTKRTSFREVTSIIDVDGDGVTDLIVRRDEGKYDVQRGALDKAGHLSFADPKPIELPPGFSAFNREPFQTSTGHAFESHLFGTFFGAMSSKTTATQDSFVSDVNGDGRPDVISKGTVFFNTSRGGAVSFSIQQPGSYIAPDIKSAGVPQKKVTELLKQIEQAVTLQIDSADTPRVDPVRAWRAPFSGDVFIHGGISFHPRTTPSDMEEQATESDPDIKKIRLKDHRDGMLFTVELNRRRLEGGAGEVVRCFAATFLKDKPSEILLVTPAALDLKPVPVVSCFEEKRQGWPDIDLSQLPPELGGNKGLLVSVEAGDVVYFRAHSIENAQDDVVRFDPAIDYVRLSEDDLPAGASEISRTIIYGIGASDPALTADTAIASVHTKASICGTLRRGGTNVDETVFGLCDPWGRSIVRYRATEEKDIFFSGSGLMIAPFAGRAHFSGTLQKPATLLSGEVAIRVLPAPPTPDAAGNVTGPDSTCAEDKADIVNGPKLIPLIKFDNKAGPYSVDGSVNHLLLEKGQRICVFLRFHSLDGMSLNTSWPQDLSAFRWISELTAVFDRRLLVVQLDKEGRDPNDLLTDADKTIPQVGLDECPAPDKQPLVVKVPKPGEDPAEPSSWTGEKTLPIHVRCLKVYASYPQTPRSGASISGHVFSRSNGAKAFQLPSRRLNSIKLPASDLTCASDDKLKEYRFRLDTRTLRQPALIPMDLDVRRPHALKQEIGDDPNPLASVPYATKQTQISRIVDGQRQPLAIRAFIVRKTVDGTVQVINDDHLSSDIGVGLERADDLEGGKTLTSQILRGLPRQNVSDVMGAQNGLYTAIKLGQPVDDNDDGYFVYPADRVGYSFCASDEVEIEIVTIVENGDADDERDDQLLDNADCSLSLCPIVGSEIRVASPGIPARSVELPIFRIGRLPIEPESYRGWSLLGVTTEFLDEPEVDNGTTVDPAVLSNVSAKLAFEAKDLPTVRHFNRLRSRFARAKDILGSTDQKGAKQAAGEALHANAAGAPPCGADSAQKCIRDKFTSQVRVHPLTGSYRATAESVSADDWGYCTDNSWRRPPSGSPPDGTDSTPLSGELKSRAGLARSGSHYCLIGPDIGLWVSEDYMSASRLGAKDLVDPVAESLLSISVEPPGNVTGRVQFLPRVSETRSEGWAASSWLGISRTKMDSRSHADVLDLNGDGFADQIVQQQAYVSDPTGRLRCLDDGVWAARFPCTAAANDKSIDFGQAFVRQSLGTTSSLSIPFSSPKTFSSSVAAASGRVGAALSAGAAQAESSRDPALSPLSIAAEFTMGESARSSDLVDLNGDGMPDFVSGQSVSLNVGHKLLAAANWQSELSREKNVSVGLSGSLGYGDDIHQVGGGISATSSRSRQQQIVTDVNGDGLADIVRADGQQIKARLNTGFGFAAERSLGGMGRSYDALSQGESDTLGANAYFTYSIPIPLPFWVFYIVLNPGVSAGAVLNRQVIAFRDIDGDGLGDLFVGGGLNVADSLDMMFDNHSAKAVVNPYGAHGQLNRVYLPTNPASKQGAPLAEAANYQLRYARTAVGDNDPQSRLVLSEVIVRDGLNADNAYGVQDRRTCHVYGGGYYDRFERRFLGFSKVVSVEGCSTPFEKRDLLQSTKPVALDDRGDHETSDALTGIRRIERTYANRSLYESGLLLSESATDLSLPSLVDGVTGSRRTLENTYALLDVGRSTYAKRQCFVLSVADGASEDAMTPRMRSTLEKGLIAFPNDADGECERLADFDRLSLRLTPVLVQSVHTASEGDALKLETAVQYAFDHRARVRRMCDLGRLDTDDDDVCSDIRYDDHIQLSFIHAATGGGTLAFDRRDRVGSLEVRVGRDSINYKAAPARKRTAAYDPATGDVLALCQFEQPGAAPDPCASITHLSQSAGDLIQANAQRVAISRYAYDTYGNIARYVSPVSGDGYFVAKRFEFDRFQNLVQLGDHQEYCLAAADKEASGLCLKGSMSELGEFKTRSDDVDWRHAVPTSQVDVNRNGLRIVLDGVGRPIAIDASWAGDGEAQDIPKPGTRWGRILEYEYRVAAELQASTALARVRRFADGSIYKATGNDADQANRITFEADYHFDHLGRQVRSMTPADACIPDAETPDGAVCDPASRGTHVATGIVLTDIADREVGRYLPVRLAALPPVATATAGPLPGEDLKLLKRTSIVVDGFDRPLHVRLTDGNSYAFRYMLANAGGNLIRHRTVARNATCVPTVVERDERGLIRGVHEFMTAGSGTEFEAHAYGSSADPQKAAHIPAAGWVKPLGIDPSSPTQQIFACVQGDATGGTEGPGHVEAGLPDPFVDTNSQRRLSSTLYAYDPLSQLTEVQLPRPAGRRLTDGVATSGKSIRSAYDGMGRRIAVDDPDRGFQFLSYDLLSNLACLRSGISAGDSVAAFAARLELFRNERNRHAAEGLEPFGEDRCLQPITVNQVARVIATDYLYDRLKQTTYVYPTPTDRDRKNVTVKYGAADAFAGNRAGRPIMVTDVTGTTETETYHALGVPEKAVRTMFDLKRSTLGTAPGIAGTLTTEEDYDAWGLLAHSTLTGTFQGLKANGISDMAAAKAVTINETVQYRHSTGGQINEIRVDAPCPLGDDEQCVGKSRVTIVRDAAFDERGNNLRLAFGNGVVVRNVFDQNSNRLISSATRMGVPCIEYGPGDDCSERSPPILFQNLSYAYDAGGLLMAYENAPAYADVRRSASPISKKHAGIQGLLITGSSNQFSYDERGRLKDTWKELSLFGRDNSYWAMNDDEFDSSKPAQAEIREAFAFTDSHLLTGIRRDVKRKFVGSGYSGAKRTTFRHYYGSQRATAPSSTRVEGPSQNQTYAVDALGRIDDIRCSGCLDKPAAEEGTFVSRDFEWDPDDTLAGMSRRVEPPSSATSATSQKNKYAIDTEQSYDHAGNRAIKRLTSVTDRPSGSDETRIRRETIYADGRLTIIREPGGRAEALLHVFAGSTRLASKRVGGTGIFTYHPQLATGTVSDVIHTTGDDPTTVRLHQQLEYAAFGEMLIGRERDLLGDERHERPLFRFDAKEWDEETQLSYFGVRHYDQRLGLWMSPDPVLGDYLDGRLSGGVYSPKNLASYGFGWGNPVGYVDKNGNYVEIALEFASLGIGYNSYLENLRKGDYWAASVDMLGMSHDFIAMAVPLYPGVAGGIRNAPRIADAITDATKSLNKIDDLAVASGKAKPIVSAGADHTTWSVNAAGNMKSYTTWKYNPKNPSNFDEFKRVDLTEGPSHWNKKYLQDIPTPHTSGREWETGSKLPGGVRPAEVREVPNRLDNWW